MKFNEIVRTLWSANRWYRGMSILVMSLFGTYMLSFVLLSVTGLNEFMNIVGVISAIFNLSIVLWLASTITVVYSFFNKEDQFAITEGSQKSVQPSEITKSVGVLGYLLENNRRYVYFSGVTALLLLGLFVSGLFINNVTSNMARNEITGSVLYQGLSEFSYIFVSIWVLWTMKITYYFKPDRMAIAPSHVVWGVRRFLISLFVVIAILLFLFVIVMMYASSART